MERDYFEEEHYIMAQKKVNAVKGFYTHLVIFLISHCIWMYIVYDFNQFESFYIYGFFGKGYGLVSSLIFWGLLILVHWYVIFGKNITFSKDWEERKVKEIMEKDKS